MRHIDDRLESTDTAIRLIYDLWIETQCTHPCLERALNEMRMYRLELRKEKSIDENLRF